MGRKRKKPKKITCSYCGQLASFMTDVEFFGKDYGTNLYVCLPCDARVGTHLKSFYPKGTLANAQLRALRKQCHNLIDPFWKNGKYKRSEVYERLAKAMNIEVKKTHIGFFNDEQCLQLIELFNLKSKGC